MHYTICLKLISSSAQVALPPAFARLEQRGEHTVSTMWTYVDCRIHAVENQGPTMSPIGLDWIGTHNFEMCALRLIGCFQTMRVHVRINCKHILIGNLLETASAAFGCGAKSKADLGITSDRLATKIHKSYLSSRSSASAISILRIFYL